jgi:hypothetical protein
LFDVPWRRIERLFVPFARYAFEDSERRVALAFFR